MSATYNFSIEGRPDYSLLRVQLNGGQSIRVEASAMATMDVNLEMKTKMKGGLGRLLGGESIFINEFTAKGGNGEITIAPNTPGDMEHIQLNNQTLFLQSSAFVASGMDVTVDSKWQGFKGFFSGEGLFLLKCSGMGDLWFNSYGGIIPIDVTDSLVVDTGHIVAFTEGLSYRVTTLGGYKSFFFSGEGLVCKFEGQGRVWIQTRKVFPLVGFLDAFRPQKS